ncbi:MAG TPA: ATP-binding cassette domain-containing protein [Terriglobia bacterium]|nr:ATP-binding cassette domain-containing protein [Terriglobia bacterium]
MDKAVSVRSITKTYDRGEAAVHALRHIDLDVASGEVVLLMGPSGSGKTTLLSIMGCILRPTSGSVRVLGREVAHLKEKELPRVRLDHIGFIFQGFNLFPTLTAGENVEVAFDLKGVGSKAARRRARELLEQVGLSEKYHTFPSDLSGGQKQRVAIARALAGEPEIILADEPTGALDWHSGRVVVEMLRSLAREQGRAVVIVTHDNRTFEFADRIVHIEDGRIKENSVPGTTSATTMPAASPRGLLNTRGMKRMRSWPFSRTRDNGPRAIQGVEMSRKSAVWIASLAGLGVAAAFFAMTHGRASQPGQPGQPSQPSQPDAEIATRAEDATMIAGPGRVEPGSEDINVGSELNGKLKAVLVDEGDRVRQGQVLAVLENDDYRAQLAADEAQVKEKEAESRKVINGARAEERREALASVNEAQAVMENTRTEMDRHQQLAREGVISRSEAEGYEREYNVAKARYDAAVQHHAFIDEPAREEDRSQAEAGVALARAQADADRARYEKTFIRAPLSSVVLRRYHRLGESVTNSFNAPDPIFTLGNTRRLRVRVDVDETDVDKLRLGQRAYVTADAFGSRKFWGHVVRVGEELGRKNIRTDEPTERVDTKILETLVELDDGRDLPIGLRVDAFILPQ